MVNTFPLQSPQVIVMETHNIYIEYDSSLLKPGDSPGLRRLLSYSIFCKSLCYIVRISPFENNVTKGTPRHNFQKVVKSPLNIITSLNNNKLMVFEH